MQAPLELFQRVWPLGDGPTVGTLMDVCEESYGALMRLVPELRIARGHLRARAPKGADLHLQVLAQSRYTTEIRLTYAFPHAPREGLPCLDPNARLCAYHDAMQVEVIDLHQSALPIYRHYAYPALDAKWKANLFLARWLRYCVGQGYSFGAGAGLAAEVADSPPQWEYQSVV
jgi:uncharacterized protein YqiB (DUF1249 family)